MTVEVLAAENLLLITQLAMELWDDSIFEEEYKNFASIIGSEKEICYLVKMAEQYVAFIHVSTRNDYVAGATALPVAYIEAVYVKPEFRQKGIAKQLIKMTKDWAMQRGIKQIASDADIDNTASLDFHKKIGFDEVERIVCLIKNV